jgi:hypothetical protein
MTRISDEIQGNPFSALVDIFEMYKSREPATEELNSMLMLMGNQGLLYDIKAADNNELLNLQSETLGSVSKILSSN